MLVSGREVGSRVTALAFSVEHGVVGAFDDRLKQPHGIGSLSAEAGNGKTGDTDTGGHREVGRCGNRIPYAIGGTLCPSRTDDIDDHEFLAAGPGDQGTPADRTSYPSSSADQHLITGRVAEAIVDFLEAVQVDDGHRHLGVRGVGVAQEIADVQMQTPPVQQAGERIGDGVVGVVTKGPDS